MTNETKQKVREFYDEIGWMQEDDGHYQNARYEDLRPVSREYIHKTRLRVMNGLIPTGRFILDAGSGPVQYEEYKTYSAGYDKRVCLDISIQALREARTRIGDHGLFVVGDLANLPFKTDAFDGAVSMHAIHHLALPEHPKAYAEIHRGTRAWADVCHRQRLAQSAAHPHGRAAHRSDAQDVKCAANFATLLSI